MTVGEKKSIEVKGGHEVLNVLELYATSKPRTLQVPRRERRHPARRGRRGAEPQERAEVREVVGGRRDGEALARLGDGHDAARGRVPLLHGEPAQRIGVVARRAW